MGVQSTHRSAPLAVPISSLETEGKNPSALSTDCLRTSPYPQIPISAAILAEPTPANRQSAPGRRWRPCSGDKEDFIRVGALDLGAWRKSAHVNVAGVGRVRARHKTCFSGNRSAVRVCRVRSWKWWFPESGWTRLPEWLPGSAWSWGLGWASRQTGFARIGCPDSQIGSGGGPG